MPITIVTGDLFKSDVECIVNTVNSVGVMGKGVAKAFMERYPRECTAFNQYSLKLCSNRAPTLLKPKLAKRDTIFPPDYIMFFPTKIHWRNDSKLEYIDRNLPLAFQLLNKYNILSAGFPWPGCGNGNLNKDDVYPLFEKHIHLYQGRILIHDNPIPL